MILSFFLSKRRSLVVVIVQMNDLLGSFTNLSSAAVPGSSCQLLSPGKTPTNQP